jgi:hypothetical protein
LAEVANTTIDNDEYSITFNLNWDDNDSSSVLLVTNDGGYKIGQKKVTKFVHTYTQERSYAVKFAATVIAPNQPSIHGVRHTANYTIAISELLCFTTSGKTHSDTVTIPSNVFTNDNEIASPVREKDVDVKNGSVQTSASSRVNFILFSDWIYTSLHLTGLMLFIL